MGMPGYSWQGLTDDIKTVKYDILRRIDALIDELNGLKHKVENDFVLNDLGELQNRPPILDARIATLATLQRMKRAIDSDS